MKNPFHGLYSLFLVVLAVAASIVTLFTYSLILGSAYLVFCAICSAVVLRIFCAKCPARDCCGHIIPGIIVSKFFPGVAPGPFTKREIIILAVILVFLLAIPQYWLAMSADVFFPYWLMLIIAVIEIRTAVCTKCKNEFCPVHPLAKSLIK